MLKTRLSPFSRMILASVMPLPALVLQYFFWEAIQPHVWFLFYPAIFFSAWIGGKRAGLAATAVSEVVVWWFFIPTRFSFALERPASLLSMVTFAGMGVLFSLTHDRFRRAEHQTEAALAAVKAVNENVEERIKERTAESDRNADALRESETRFLHTQKMEAIGRLAGGIAHDFNNILNVIMGYGGMVLKDLAPEDPLREQMREVITAAERATILTKRLLVFSRKQVVEMRPVDVNSILSDVEKTLGGIIGGDIELQVIPADKRLTVQADESQIDHVLMNLATNARDAMPQGGRLTIRTQATQIDDAFVAACGYGKSGAYALITVSDTGLGMDAETQRKIFEPFFTTKGIGEGIGLGLAISYEIVKQHNGYIHCSSEPGRGTVFNIYLPVYDGPSVADKMPGNATVLQGGTETILVAEDDPSLRKLTGIILESFGYSVIMAENGEDAVTKYLENSEKIQMVILDMIMPKKSGKEAYEEIIKKSPGIRVLFMSGYTMDMISGMDIEGGMELIRKPFAPNELLARTRAVLDRKE